MEAPCSASLGAMGSLLMKLDDRALQQFSDEAQKFKVAVGSISTKLERLSEVHDPPLTVSYWKKDAEELSYDMVDFIDQFVQVQLGSADADPGCAGQISGFKARIEELEERFDRYRLKDILIGHTTNTLQMVYGRELEPAGDLDGMDGMLNKEILWWLMPKGEGVGEEELKVASILGDEGIGKSTLAGKLWRHQFERDYFECRVFVRTSKKPDMRMILRSILSQIQPKKRPEASQVPDLIRDIRKHLQDKRYSSTRFKLSDSCIPSSHFDTKVRAVTRKYL